MSSVQVRLPAEINIVWSTTQRCAESRTWLDIFADTLG
jgi:hypothetical protein